MSHPKITVARMLDWIRACIDTGVPLPTDNEIMGHFGLTSPESARSLLAALADAGEITIKGWGTTRAITLGRAARHAVVAEKPIRSVRKPMLTEEQQIEAGMIKLKAALARGKAAVGPASRNTPEASGTTRKVPSGTVLAVPSRASGSASPIEPPADRLVRDTVDAGAQREVSAAPAAPHPVMAELAQIPPEVVAELSKQGQRQIRQILAGGPEHASPPDAKRLPTTGNPLRGRPKVAVPVREARTQINIHMPTESFARLDAAATAADMQTSSFARMLVMGGLERPRIPGAVTSAAMRAGVPVIDFAAMLMLRGLETYQGAPA